jgi:hypothetical protein
VQTPLTDEEIVQRCVYAMQNKGARILARASLRAVDTASRIGYGYGFHLPRRAHALPPTRSESRACACDPQLRALQPGLWLLNVALLLETLARDGKRFNDV